jgi:hypothetical protein
MFTSLKSRIVTGAALLTLASAALVPTAALAEPKGTGGGSANGCLIVVEDANGEHAEIVPVGTRIGLFVCSADGEWHLGIGIDARPVGSAGTAASATAAPALNVQR